MVAPADRSLDGFISRIPLTGKPKPRSLVTGALIITRLSKPKEKMSSLSMQERHARTYVAETLKIPVLAVFADIKSGLLKRNGYTEAMRRARLGLCSHIVVYDYDRFSRERVTSLKDYADLEALGIEMYDTLMGYIPHDVAGEKAVAAEAEGRKTSRRVLDNMMERAMNEDDYNMPRRAPWGYRKTVEPGKPEPDPDKGPIVTALFRRYDAGETEGSLRQWYNSIAGRRVRADGIVAMLRNEYYAGIAIWNKECRSKFGERYAKDRSEWAIRRHDQPLIDMETFERVQARLDRNANHGQRRTAKSCYALRGVVVCARCGVRTRGLTQRKRQYACLVCQGCGRSRAYKRVEAVVQEALAPLPLGNNDIVQGRSGATDVVGRVQAITARIEKVRDRRARLINKREDGEYEEADYRRAMAATERELDDLTTEREQIVQGEREAVSIDETLRWLRTLSDWTDVIDAAQTTPEERNAVYRQCFSRIVVDFAANTLTVHWMPALARLRGRESEELSLGPLRKGAKGAAV